MSFIVKVFVLIYDLFDAIAEIASFDCMLPDETILSRHIKKLLSTPDDRKKLFETLYTLKAGKTDSIEVTFSDGQIIRFFL